MAGRDGPANDTVYVSKLPPGTDKRMLAEYFGSVGLLKRDRWTGGPKIWLCREKISNEAYGDATVSYEDPNAALVAVQRFHNKYFYGGIIEVYIAEPMSRGSGDRSYSQQLVHAAGEDLSGQEDANGCGGRGNGQGGASAKSWREDGDWLCPNSSCANANFAFCDVCNQCGTACPDGAGGTEAAAAGHGRGSGSNDAVQCSLVVGGSAGLFGPNGWPCPLCGKSY